MLPGVLVFSPCKKCFLNRATNTDYWDVAALAGLRPANQSVAAWCDKRGGDGAEDLILNEFERSYASAHRWCSGDETSGNRAPPPSRQCTRRQENPVSRYFLGERWAGQKALPTSAGCGIQPPTPIHFLFLLLFPAHFTPPREQRGQQGGGRPHGRI